MIARSPLAALDVSVWQSVDEIDAAAWEHVRDPENVFMDRRLMRAVEKSMRNQSEFYYVLFRDGAGQPAAITCLSTFTVDPFVLAANTWTNSLLQEMQQRWPNYFYHKVLFCGQPFSASQSYLGFVEHADRRQIIIALDRLMQTIAHQVEARLIILKEFCDSEISELPGLEQLGYRRADSLPQNLNHIQHTSFQDYLQEKMCSRKRWDVRKTMKKVDDAGLEVRFTSDPEEIAKLYTDEVHALYTAVYDKAERKLEWFPPDFFRELPRQLPDNCTFCFIAQGARVLAFLVNVFSGTTYYPLFVGVDYDQNREFALYFNVMYRSFADGIDRGMRTIEMGQNTDEFKHSKLGCHHSRRHMFIKGVHAPMRWALRMRFDQMFPKQPLLN